MNNIKIFFAILFAAGMFAACSDETIVASIPEEILPDSILHDRTLYPDTVYTFQNRLIVSNNTVLTILAGTVIKAKDSKAGKGSSDYFIIDRGSKIMAEGTSEKPIVFTVGGPATNRQHGEWGGVVILGKAPVAGYDEMYGTPISELSLRGTSLPFGGGDDPTDNSGILRYVRIEFAGLYLGQDSFGLACVGVGSGTVIDHVQTSYTYTSGFGFYGGTVNARYLVAFNTRVAGFVYANGYSGNQQFILSYKHPYFSARGPFVNTSDGILAYNDMFNYPIEKNTRPVLSNVTVIGPNNNPGYNSLSTWNSAVNISFGSAMVLRNSVLMGMPKGGILFTDDVAAQQLINGVTSFSNNLVHSNSFTSSFTVDPNSVYSTDSTTVINYAEANANVRFPGAAEIGLQNPFDFKSPLLTLNDNSPARTGADFTGSDLSNPFFQTVTYRGAFDKDNWLNGWTDFYPFQ